MHLDILPERHGGAAENMATDFLLLQRYPAPENARFRHYGWHRPAFTFGYGQTLAFVKSQLPDDDLVELCRRPTGGGIVDHRNDWTYALVLPAEHALYEARATESYRLVHACIADALQAIGQAALIKQPDTTSTISKAQGPGVCFENAENFDVIHPKTGQKIAGAAQKRSKQGMLFQGSISREAVASDLDWDAFEEAFAARLAKDLSLEPLSTPWPEFSETELDALTEQYSSEEWNGYR
jgi:lipoate-protein ligase A